MTNVEETNFEERALIPNVMQPSPINNRKIAKIDQKKVIHALKINTRDE